MKKILIVSFVALVSVLSSNELAWVDKQIDSIKPPREGISSSAITSLSDPFIFLKKPVETTTKGNTAASNSYVFKSGVKTAPTLRLTAIMNDSALINGKWYKVGDTLHGYKLLAINTKSVNLRSKKTKLTLSTQSNSQNLKFKNK
ncbi:hypothetical protein KKG77_03785 [bacterium]|nr:hypothetical protein [bacterium]